MTDDYDTPWKDALTRYFPEFMAFYFPSAHAQIDWSVPYVFLEQELAQVVSDAKLGRRRVDKLVRVALIDGADEWVFVHIDVQGNYDSKFAERIFVYNYRIYDRYRRPVASLALLADGKLNWRPSSFRYALLGCETGIRFPLAKLRDYAPRLQQLLSEENVFALVTAAHLLTQQTRGQHVKRFEAKIRLTRLLFGRAWSKQRIIDLFRVIDWMMRTPPELEAELLQDIENFKKERIDMKYIDPFERLGMARGRKEALVEIVTDQLSKRFGTLPQSINERLQNASAAELRSWALAVLDAPTLDSVFMRT